MNSRFTYGSALQRIGIKTPDTSPQNQLNFSSVEYSVIKVIPNIFESSKTPTNVSMQNWNIIHFNELIEFKPRL